MKRSGNTEEQVNVRNPEGVTLATAQTGCTASAIIGR